MRPRLRLRRRGAGTPGFTLIELLVVLVIAAVLMAVAVPSMSEFRRSSELNSATNGLLAAINAMRTEAMRRGSRAVMIPYSGDDWTGGWRAFVDLDMDGQLSTGDAVILEHKLPADGFVLITGSGTAAEAGGKYLLFDASGYAKSTAGAFSASTLSLQRRDNPEPAGSRLVKVARTGRVRSCRPSGPDCDSQDD